MLSTNKEFDKKKHSHTCIVESNRTFKEQMICQRRKQREKFSGQNLANFSA